MAKGLVKAKEYDWKDSNLALFGSDIEKNVKREAAGTELAWQSAGKRCGLQIWRIEQFKVKALQRNDYGKFYNGDSYIILNTYQKEESDEFFYDVHFWIGSNSSQDEYGTAAYKTVELDIYLGDKPVQHREVMGHESKLFKSYFPTLRVLEGGVKSGFKHVLPQNYESRLLRVRGTTIRNCKVEQVPFTKHSLDSNDVFILDKGTTLYQWNGRGCDKDEKFKATQVTQEIKSERNGRVKIEVFDEDEISSEHVFYKFFPNKTVEQHTGDYDSFGKALFRLSDKHGSLSLSQVSKGRISMSNFNSNDVFLFDTGHDLFVWIGAKASVDERRKALEYGHNYLIQTDHPCAAITCISEGDHNEDFAEALD
ncbi:gelsolin-like protein 1 [Actinia tenebrosa]|uniref:Gelsolin-like protein 1 n=1 Tax=Actinia tenebrosa TaxID=6105 RepID=A0A6P8IA26_ACTTE|nr:gelsolin-like protein 1 [Actinia tenebrosa]